MAIHSLGATPVPPYSAQVKERKRRDVLRPVRQQGLVESNTTAIAPDPRFARLRRSPGRSRGSERRGEQNYTVATVGDSSPAVMGEGLYPLTTR